MLNENANQHQDDMKQQCTHEENNIENDEVTQFREKIVDSEKHCCVTNHKNFLRVSYAEILKQPIRRLKSYANSDSEIISECNLTQNDQTLLEALQ